MLRRVARERREYLNKKQEQLQEAKLNDRRKQIQKSLSESKPLGKDLRQDSKLLKDYQYDASLVEKQEDCDDEYFSIGTRDPKVLITTSRDPSSRLQQFAKEIRILIPNSFRMNRGNSLIDAIVKTCRANDVTDLVMLHEHRGQPDALVICHFPYGPTTSFTLHNVILRHDLPDIGTVSEAFPHLIFDNLTTNLGQRTQRILSALFPPTPKENSPRVVTFANTDDFISLRQHLYVATGPKSVELAEVGPRFEMRLFEIKLGTIENKFADIEWRLRNLRKHKKHVL